LVPTFELAQKLIKQGLKLGNSQCTVEPFDPNNGPDSVSDAGGGNTLVPNVSTKRSVAGAAG